MVTRVFAADAIGGAPVYSGRALRQLQSPFTAGATPSRPLGARSGVRPGTATTTVTATATTWSVGAHAGILDVQTAAEAGPYAFAVDAAVTGAMTAANATNPRTDIIYDQLNDNAEDSTGSVAASVTPKYLAGAAQADAPVPATPARSIVLARINVPRSGAGNPSVTWVAPYAASAGGMLPVYNQTERDALTKTEPLLIWRLDKHWAEFWNGSGWEVIGTHAERDTFVPYNSGAYIGGGQTIRSVTIDASPQPQRVQWGVDGLVSPLTEGRIGIGVATTAGQLIQNPQVRIYSNIGGQFYGYSRKGYLLLAANQAATLTFVTEGDTSGAYQVTTETHVLAAGQY